MYTCTTVRELDNMYVLGCEEIGEKKGACWRGGGASFFLSANAIGVDLHGLLELLSCTNPN
jgi:hypothetical protein